MKLGAYLEILRAPCGFGRSEISEWKVFIFFEDWGCFVICICTCVWGSKNGNLVSGGCSSAFLYSLKFWILIKWLLGYIMVYFMVRQCLWEQDEEGRQIPTLLWMQWLFVYLLRKAVCCLCWLTHTYCVASFCFILSYFIVIFHLKETEKKKSEKLCVVLCVWSAGSVQIAATFQKKAQLIYSRGVKEGSSSRSNCPLLQIMQCSLNPLDITWKSILFAVFFNTTSPLDSRNNEWDVLAGIYRM